MNYNKIVICNMCGKRIKFKNANEGVRNTVLCNNCWNKIYGEGNVRIVEVEIAEADKELAKHKV